MAQEPLTLYKLIVLYMLRQVDFPLTKNQIAEFILEKEYTNYMTLQQAISELIDANMLSAKSIGNRTHLVISEEGSTTLQYFENRISDAIKQDIATYFAAHKFSLRNETSVLADYYKSTSGEFDADLIVKEKDIELIHLKLSVPTKEMAASICDNWQKKHETIYQYITGELF